MNIKITKLFKVGDRVRVGGRGLGEVTDLSCPGWVGVEIPGISNAYTGSRTFYYLLMQVQPA